MAKKAKKTAKKKVAKKAPRQKRHNRGWGQTFTFVKVLKVEPPKDGVYGCVYQALRKVKSGTVEQVMEEAMKLGLNKATKQNPKIQTQIKLRRLVREGAAKMEKGKKEKKEKKAEKTSTKKSATKKASAKKSFKIKKETAPPESPKDEAVEE